MSLHKTPICIDEVQYAPELFSYIKIAIDNGAKPGSFYLTGRVAIINMSALSQSEIYIHNNGKLALGIEHLKKRPATLTKR